MLREAQLAYPRSPVRDSVFLPYLKSRVKADNPFLYAAPAESEIQNAGLGSCFAELHASPYHSEYFVFLDLYF